MESEIDLKTVKKPVNNGEVFEYFIGEEDRKYMSVTIRNPNQQVSSDLPGLYRAEWNADVDEKSFKNVVMSNLPTDTILSDTYVPERFLEIEGEDVRSGGTMEDMYVEFPQVPYHDQNLPYHNLSFNRGENSLSLEVRDNSVEPLERWFRASKDIEDDKAETIIQNVKEVVNKHLEKGS